MCPFGIRETEVQTADDLWTSVIIEGSLARWKRETESSETIFPNPVAFQMASDVLIEYQRIQMDRPHLSFALPTVTLDVVNRGMFLDFREEKKLVSCCCKDNLFIVSFRSAVVTNEKRDNPRDVAVLPGDWVRKFVFIGT